MRKDNGDGFLIVVCIFLLILGSFSLWVNVPESEHTTTIEEEQRNNMFIVGQEESFISHIEFYDSWVSDDRTSVETPVVVRFKVRWNDTLEDIEWGLCAEVYDGTRYYQLSYHPNGWELIAEYDDVCKKNFTVVSVGYFGERHELNGESVLFEQTVESPEVIWDRVIVRYNPLPEETTTILPEECPFVMCVAVGGVVVIAVISLALLRRNGRVIINGSSTSKILSYGC